MTMLQHKPRAANLLTLAKSLLLFRGRANQPPEPESGAEPGSPVTRRSRRERRSVRKTFSLNWPMTAADEETTTPASRAFKPRYFSQKVRGEREAGRRRDLVVSSCPDISAQHTVDRLDRNTVNMFSDLQSLVDTQLIEISFD